MLVNLSRNSWHSELYNYVKGNYPTYAFKSLCPYFWTIVSYLLLLPVIVLWKVLNSFLAEPIKKGILLVFDRPPSKIPVKKEPSKFSKLFRKILPIIYFGFVGLLSLFCIFMMIVNLFKQKGVWLGFVYLFSVIGMLAVLLCIIWLIISFFETDIWKMIKGMGYSVKNKVCPIIKWDK
jgi:hypothetical protein